MPGNATTVGWLPSNKRRKAFVFLRLLHTKCQSVIAVPGVPICYPSPKPTSKPTLAGHHSPREQLVAGGSDSNLRGPRMPARHFSWCKALDCSSSGTSQTASASSANSSSTVNTPSRSSRYKAM